MMRRVGAVALAAGVGGVLVASCGGNAPLAPATAIDASTPTETSSSGSPGSSSSGSLPDASADASVACVPTRSDGALDPAAMFPTAEALLVPRAATYDDVVPDTLDLEERAKSFLQGAARSLLVEATLHHAPPGPTVFHGADASEAAGPLADFYGNPHVLCEQGTPPCFNRYGSAMWGYWAKAMYAARRMVGREDGDPTGTTLALQWTSFRELVTPENTLAMQSQSVYGPLDLTGAFPFPAASYIMSALADVLADHPEAAAVRSGVDFLNAAHRDKLQCAGAECWYADYDADLNFVAAQGTTGYAQAFINGETLGILNDRATRGRDCSAAEALVPLRGFVLGHNASELWWNRGQDALYPAETGQFVGHIFSYVTAATAVFETAIPLRESDPAAFRGYGDFARNVYEFVKRRTEGDAIGNFGEIGTSGRVAKLGLLLADYGILGDEAYQETDRWLRNQLVEAQIDQAAADALPASTSAIPEYDDVAHKAIGTFFSDATHSFAVPINKNARWNEDGPVTGWMGLQQFYDRVVRVRGNVARVDFLLNRSHRIVDVKSHVPFKGRVELTTHADLGGVTSIEVRLPDYAKATPDLLAQVAVTIDGAAPSTPWTIQGDFVVLSSVAPGHTYAITFAIPDEQRVVVTRRSNDSWWYEGSYAQPGTETRTAYTGTFRGHTLLAVAGTNGDPRLAAGCVPRFQRAAYLNADPNAPTPTRTVRRSPPLHESTP